MVTRIEKENQCPYQANDPVRPEYISFLLHEKGISQTLKKGFNQNPQGWLSANATKDYIDQFYDDIAKGEIRADTTMSELDELSATFHNGYEVAQHDISQILKIPDDSALKEGHVW
ncbi:MAG: hypothetical protein QQM50_02080 [Dehalococcoides mccartyi]|uniref:Uncharacterized protein n=1 Tax=Dehalococcoides mccartyi TaxID=61435 RepID=A0AB38Z7W3_9CHLR|nr:hypothetical protein [Dehalococcoides mccartyi]MDP4279323.1 hypothetical protein [Dehalococcoides mccartyi]WRO06669.1 hypothetical protein VLL09_04570 [Dehalococcoides mccartyi]